MARQTPTTNITPQQVATFDQKLGKIRDEMKRRGYDVTVISRGRTAAQEAEFFRTGKSQIDPATGKLSHHQTNTGADFAFVVNGKPSFDLKLPWKTLGEVAKAEGLTWGGDWKTLVDLGHVQLTPDLPKRVTATAAPPAPDVTTRTAPAAIRPSPVPIAAPPPPPAAPPTPPDVPTAAPPPPVTSLPPPSLVASHGPSIERPAGYASHAPSAAKSSLIAVGPRAAPSGPVETPPTYLSTDPRAGEAISGPVKYLSTDPNAGVPMARPSGGGL